MGLLFSGYFTANSTCWIVKELIGEPDIDLFISVFVGCNWYGVKGLINMEQLYTVKPLI